MDKGGIFHNDPVLKDRLCVRNVSFGIKGKLHIIFFLVGLLC